MTVSDILHSSTELLRKNNLDDGRLNAELILCEVLNCDRMNLYLNFDKPLSNEEKNLIESYLNRRSKREPLQYIFGKAHFYGIEFIVDRSVLIPRPETEQLVEKILQDISNSSRNKVTIFEIGSGSGCIAIVIAKILSKQNIGYEIFSIDNSQEAIDVAGKNLKLILPDDKGVRFYKKDVFEIEKMTKSFEYIVSNPPYISLDEFNLLEKDVKDYEPESALTDHGSGLKYFERIFKIISDDNFKGKVFCEIGFGQKEKIDLLLKNKDFSQYFFHKDYNDIYRILEIIK